MRVLLLPPDGLPNNAELPRALASIAGHEVVVPPERLLGDGRAPADPAPLLAFLASEASRADALVVSADLLVHGGADFATEPTLGAAEAGDRLARVSTALRGFGEKTTILSIVTPDSFPCRREADLAQRDDLARWNALRGRALNAAESIEKQTILARLPNETLESHDSARERNIGIQRRLTDWLRLDVVAAVAFAYDDVGAQGPRAEEVEALRRDTKGLHAHFLAGADGAAAMLVASALLEPTAPIYRLRVVLADAPSLDRAAPGDSQPFRDRFHEALRFLGFVIDNQNRDLDLFAQAPLAYAVDLARQPAPAPGPPLEEFIAWLTEAIRKGKSAILADCGHARGADASLMAAIPKDTLGGLAAFAAGGTPQSAIAGALAHGAMILLGKETQRWDVAESLRLTKKRCLDDWLFQGIARGELDARCRREGIDRFDFGDRAAELDSALDARLHELAAEFLPFGIPPFLATFPRRRLSECRIRWL